MRSYDAVLFDLDGTLTDPAVGITRSVAYDLIKMKIPVGDHARLTRFIGPPLGESFQKYYGLSEDGAARAVEFYREYFRETGIFENAVYDGIVPLLEALKGAGKTLAVATSKPDVFAARIVAHFRLDGFFAFVAGSRLDGTRTKKHEVIEHALSALGITDRASAVMIGDREHDVIGAKRAGIDSIGVRYGYGTADELQNAGTTYIADSPGEIFRLICDGQQA